MSFETPFDFYQRLHYKNTSVSEVMKNLAIITNRYFYINEENVVHMTPRGNPDYNPTRELKRKYFLSRKVKMKRDVEVKVKLKRYEQDSDGKVSNYGIVVREAEWDFIQAYYAKLLSGDIITNDFEIVNPNDMSLVDDRNWESPKLMDEIFLDEQGDMTKLGVVIQKDEGTENSKIKYVTQFVKDGEVI